MGIKWCKWFPKYSIGIGWSCYHSPSNAEIEYAKQAGMKCCSLYRYGIMIVDRTKGNTWVMDIGWKEKQINHS